MSEVAQVPDREGKAVDRPLVSIVMATYNTADALQLTLKSVLAQRLKVYEVVIIDGGSKDHTPEILKSLDRRLAYWVSEPDLGIYDAFNKACRVVRGEWVLFLGAGDLLYEETVLSYFSAAVAEIDDRTELVYGKVSVTDAQYNCLEMLNRPWAEMAGKWRGGRPMLPHHQGVFHRRWLLSGPEPFDLKYQIAADSNLIFQSIARAAPVFIDQVIASAPEGGVSTNFRQYLKTAMEIIKINQKLKHGHHLLQAVFYLKILSAYIAYRIGGEKFAKFCIAAYRQLVGRSLTGADT